MSDTGNDGCKEHRTQRIIDKWKTEYMEYRIEGTTLYSEHYT